jgi:hypothetical protein
VTKKNGGIALVILGGIGVLLMLVGFVFAVRLSLQVNDTADEIVAPITTGLDTIDAQLTTVEKLVDEFSEIVTAEAVADLAQKLGEANARLEGVGGYLDIARSAVAALDAIPFIPVDLTGLNDDLDGLEEGLRSLTSGLDQVTQFVLKNQEVPAQVEAEVNAGLAQLRTGLTAAQQEVADVDDAAQWWLGAGMVWTFAILLWGMLGQIGLIAFGLQLRRSEATHASTRQL